MLAAVLLGACLASWPLKGLAEPCNPDFGSCSPEETAEWNAGRANRIQQQHQTELAVRAQLEQSIEQTVAECRKETIQSDLCKRIVDSRSERARAANTRAANKGEPAEPCNPDFGSCTTAEAEAFRAERGRVYAEQDRPALEAYERRKAEIDRDFENADKAIAKAMLEGIQEKQQAEQQAKNNCRENSEKRSAAEFPLACKQSQQVNLNNGILIPIVSCTAMSDAVDICDIEINRGNCGAVLFDSEGSGTTLPVRLKFGQTAKWAPNCTVIEMRFRTSVGVWTLNWKK